MVLAKLEPVDEPVQAVVTKLWFGDLVVTKPTLVGSKKRFRGELTLNFESGNLQKLVALSSFSYIFHFVFSRVFAAEMWVIRIVSFEAMLGQISVVTAILEFNWSRPFSSQILSSVHLTAALKELVACGLVYALSSVSGLTTVAFTGNALPTQTTEGHFTIGLCRENCRDVGISRHLAVAGGQSFKDPTIFGRCHLHRSK